MLNHDEEEAHKYCSEHGTSLWRRPEVCRWKWVPMLSRPGLLALSGRGQKDSERTGLGMGT